jgi:hypothetical protein
VCNTSRSEHKRTFLVEHLLRQGVILSRCSTVALSSVDVGQGERTSNSHVTAYREHIKIISSFWCPSFNANGCFWDCVGRTRLRPDTRQHRLFETTEYSYLLVLRRVRCNDLKLVAINTTVTSWPSDRCFHDPQTTQRPPLRVIMSVLGHSKTHLTTPDM